MRPVATDVTSKAWRKLTQRDNIVFQSSIHIKFEQTKTSKYRNSFGIKVTSFVLKNYIICFRVY